MRHTQIYRTGRGNKPRSVRVQPLDANRNRNIACGLAIVGLVGLIGLCCGGVLFALATRLLDW